MSRYSELSERTYRRHFAKPYRFISLNQGLIVEAIVSSHYQIAVIDASFVPKSGKATYGLDRFYNGKASRAERRLGLSMIAVVDGEQAIGYSLSVQHPPALEPDSKRATERPRVDD